MNRELNIGLRELYNHVEEDWVEDGRFYLKDEKGHEIVSKLNEMLAQEDDLPEMLKGRQFVIFDSKLMLANEEEALIIKKWNENAK